MGQGVAVQILKNQVENHDVVQAYLFCGPAGTGKTTIARLFAKYLNGDTTSVVEMDAASNTGVDSIRSLKENSQFLPMSAKYRIYIIDEVHMLSTSAFNALLKLLEEPPASSIFILCTTDPQKIPHTVRSRLQQYDFTRVPSPLVYRRLCEVAAKEAIEVEEAATQHITEIASGCMRDALKYLEMAASYEQPVTVRTVDVVLGREGLSTTSELLEFVLQQEDGRVLETVEKLYDSGVDMLVYVKALMETLLAIGRAKWDDRSPHFALWQQFEKKKVSPLDWFVRLSSLYNDIRYEDSKKLFIEGELLWMIFSVAS